MLSCNGIALNYAIVMYDESKSKIKIVQDIADELPAASVISYLFVTTGSRSYYVYRYEGNLNGIKNAVVLVSYPKEAFHNPKALRAFISTDACLSTHEILDRYVERWSVEVFFRQSKDKLEFDQY